MFQNNNSISKWIFGGVILAACGVGAYWGAAGGRLGALEALVGLERADTIPSTTIATDTLDNAATKEPQPQVVDPNQKVVYLTFDDGPSKNTPDILRVLREEGVKATFFVTAQFPKFLPYLTEEAREGHMVAAHSYSHDFNVYENFDTYFADMDSIQQIIKQYTGHRTPLIRFPGGSSNRVAAKRFQRDIMPDLTEEVQRRGYQYVDWNLDSHDAAGRNVSVARLVRNSCHADQTHICLLMHDAPGKRTTVEALPAIIDFYRREGYAFDVLSATGYQCHHRITRKGCKP